MKTLSHYLAGLKEGAQIDVKAPPSGALAGTTVLVPSFETEQLILTASSASSTIFVPDNVSGSWQVAAVAVRFGTASSSGTLQVEVAGSGTAVGSGTNQLTGTVSLSGTANTTANGTVIAAPTTITAGMAVNVILAGTLTGLANGMVTVVLRRVA